MARQRGYWLAAYSYFGLAIPGALPYTGSQGRVAMRGALRAEATSLNAENGQCELQ